MNRHPTLQIGCVAVAFGPADGNLVVDIRVDVGFVRFDVRVVDKLSGTPARVKHLHNWAEISYQQI